MIPPVSASLDRPQHDAPPEVVGAPDTISAPAAAVADELRALPSIPVPPSMRRFIRPLVGIDPDSVRIHRGQQAAALADRHNADAIAVGDDIAIGAGHDDRDPATTALIAHELIHSARARDRRFVPPIARNASAPAARPPERTTAVTRGTVSTDDEETLAQTVETRVRAAAARERERETPHQVTRRADQVDDVRDDDGFDNGAPQVTASPVNAPRAHDVADASAPPPTTRTGRSPWGSLPAPWEPLPATLAQSRSAEPASTERSAATVVTTVPSAQSTPPTTTAEAAPVVHRAERGGGSAGEEPPHADAPATPGEGPDIDALARQVYTVLKRRIAAESRRGA